jgi:hypothetical protein
LLFQPRSRPLGRQARVRAGSQPAIPEPAVALRLVPPNTQTVSSRVALRKASATGVARIAALRNSSYPRIAGPSGTLSVVLAPSIAFVQYANLRGAAYGHVDGATHSGAGVRKPPEAAAPSHAKALTYPSSGCREISRCQTWMDHRRQVGRRGRSADHPERSHRDRSAHHPDWRSLGSRSGRDER